MNPTNLKYTKDHEWIKVEGTKATIGITDHAQSALGDVVFVELPAVGDSLEEGKPFGVVESVKAVSDIYAPVSGTVTAINETLLDSPEVVNQDAFGEAWMVEVEISDPAQLEGLMDAAQYEAFVKEEAH
ncbi:MAG TPA: glycine cleavage system protein GcvH [Verrucomicrobiae bacterium]|nr:glycine cleavage system protein GcvH [Verrucomicrobiae bacterium]